MSRPQFDIQILFLEMMSAAGVGTVLKSNLKKSGSVKSVRVQLKNRELSNPVQPMSVRVRPRNRHLIKICAHPHSVRAKNSGSCFKMVFERWLGFPTLLGLYQFVLFFQLRPHPKRIICMFFFLCVLLGGVVFLAGVFMPPVTRMNPKNNDKASEIPGIMTVKELLSDKTFQCLCMLDFSQNRNLK